MFFSTLNVHCQVGVRGSSCPSLAFTLLKRKVIFLAFLVFFIFSVSLVCGFSRSELLFFCLFLEFFCLCFEPLDPVLGVESLILTEAELRDFDPVLEAEASVQELKHSH